MNLRCMELRKLPRGRKYFWCSSPRRSKWVARRRLIFLAPKGVLWQSKKSQTETHPLLLTRNPLKGWWDEREEANLIISFHYEMLASPVIGSRPSQVPTAQGPLIRFDRKRWQNFDSRIEPNMYAIHWITQKNICLWPLWISFSFICYYYQLCS